ncbi:hypothetical protein AGDE_04080 [Angomonas deanei]|uniref:DUF1279 domain-containing protein n=1 Tax=Angomonas deanei TaxID=59799 RepID=S9V6I9_9TRYP|nr:hypothetical protein AGDE_05287 [Angomonas deanei]EPY39848.1 hypothetical protein AGDE_04080 [Angomonas deanei]CAD2221183.1 hypothetical protein, conserved [Angomonas deanei]|eukprot:EPY38642.1 hypothetical protein AGDE_05287 [Angomonas deanei]
MLRRLSIAPVVRASGAPNRSLSVKKLVAQHGVKFVVFYVCVNETIVIFLTYLLHYNYFGKDDLVGVLEKVGASKYFDLSKVEHKSWTLFNGRLEISARLLANFAAASLFMSLVTPVKLPVLIGIYARLQKRFGVK